MIYSILHENCQAYCLKLLECIRTPLSLSDIFRGLDRVPKALSDKILLQRYKDFLDAPEPHQMGFTEPLTSIPTCVETVCLIAFECLLVLVGLCLVSDKLIVVWMLTALAYAQHSHPISFRVLSELIWKPPKQDDMLLMIYNQTLGEAQLSTRGSRRLDLVNGSRRRYAAADFDGIGSTGSFELFGLQSSTQFGT